MYLMETTQKQNNKNPYITSKNSLSTTGIIVVIVAAAAFYAGSLTNGNSVLSMSLFMLGVALGIFGLIKLFMGKKVFYCRESGTKVALHRLTFDKNEIRHLQRILEEKTFEQIGSINKGSNKSSDIRLDIYISTDKQYATAQIMEFVPFEYQAVGEARQYTGNDAAALATAIG